MDAAKILSTVSLRRTALVYLTILLSLVGLATIAVAYLYAHQAATEFLDGQLHQIALNAGPGLPTANAPTGDDQDPEDRFAVTIWDAAGKLVHASLPSVHIPRQSRAGFADVEAGGEKWRIYTTGDGLWTVQVAQREVVRQEIAQSAAVGAAAPILFAIPLAWLVVGWAMNRVLGRLKAQADELAERSAGATAPFELDRVPAEVAPLVRSMNGLIVRLHAAVEAQKRFLSDSAHELRTPLAAIQIQVDNLVREAGSEQSKAATALAGGVRRASALVNQLLSLAKLDETAEAQDETVDVGSLLLDCVADHASLVAAKQIELEVNVEGGARCRGAREELRILFSNLIGNAVRYTPEDGDIDVSMRESGKRIIVEVCNSGTALPEGAEARVFDRFFRAAPQGIEGSGLGLAIARRIADRHAFGLTVENHPDGATGVLARVLIPANASG